MLFPATFSPNTQSYWDRILRVYARLRHSSGKTGPSDGATCAAIQRTPRESRVCEQCQCFTTCCAVADSLRLPLPERLTCYLLNTCSIKIDLLRLASFYFRRLLAKLKEHLTRQEENEPARAMAACNLLVLGSGFADNLKRPVF
eukprot:6188911-Pleurochrysis_carterae.AAC.2